MRMRFVVGEGGGEEPALPEAPKVPKAKRFMSAAVCILLDGAAMNVVRWEEGLVGGSW